MDALAALIVPPRWELSEKLPVGIVLLIVGAYYFDSWRRHRRAEIRPKPPLSRLVWFESAILVLILALVTPLHELGERSFAVHMLQHDLLIFLVPVLLARGWLEPWWPPVPHWLRAVLHFCTRPIPALVFSTVALWVWHAPRLYQGALVHEGAHSIEHLCFLVGYLFFWWPLAAPVPEARHWSNGKRLAYLLAAGTQMSVLAAALTFATHAWYTYYAALPGQNLSTALASQQLGGLLMWVPGMVIFGAVSLANVRPETPRPARVPLPHGP